MRQNTCPIIMVAPTGARRTKADNPNLPITLEEIIRETKACAKAGAHALHLHIRDNEGRHSLDAGRYCEALTELNRALPGFPVQITTESTGLYDVERQVACLRNVAPQAASISVRETARDAGMANVMYGLCAEMGTRVQHIIYATEDWHQLLAWQESGVVRSGQNDAIVVLGQYGSVRNASVQDVAALAPLSQQSKGRVMVCAFGPTEQEVLCAAAALGADVRIGFENNIHSLDGSLAQSNAAQVASLVAGLQQTQREKVAT